MVSDLRSIRSPTDPFGRTKHRCGGESKQPHPQTTTTLVHRIALVSEMVRQEEIGQ
jgi:hypothetical protein